MQSEGDRLPPHDTEAEMAVIGCCLTEPERCITEAQMTILQPEYFYDLRCRNAWTRANSMLPSDVNTITIRCDSLPFDFLNQCQDLAVSTANLPSWLEIVEKRFIARRLIQTSQDIIRKSYELADALEDAESAILKIRPNKVNQESLSALLLQATGILEKQAESNGEITGYSTGLVDLDRKTDGLHPGEFVVIAALPSCGKTALAVNVSVSNAMRGIPAGVFSAEMRPVQLVVRSLCSESKVNPRELCEEDIKKLIVTTSRVSKSPLHIQSASGFSIGQLKAAIRRMKQQHKIQIAVVDYIQLIAGTGDNREQQIASVSRGLKAIALELDICVIGLSQVNDDGKLRESRAIGQDADSVWVLENDGEWHPINQPVQLKIQKCRDGETGMVRLLFMKQWTRFECPAPITNYDAD